MRKTHCHGRKHKDAVRDYYQHWLEQQVQKIVDETSMFIIRLAIQLYIYLF